MPPKATVGIYPTPMSNVAADNLASPKTKRPVCGCTSLSIYRQNGDDLDNIIAFI